MNLNPFSSRKKDNDEDNNIAVPTGFSVGAAGSTAPFASSVAPSQPVEDYTILPDGSVKLNHANQNSNPGQTGDSVGGNATAGANEAATADSGTALADDPTAGLGLDDEEGLSDDELAELDDLGGSDDGSDDPDDSDLDLDETGQDDDDSEDNGSGDNGGTGDGTDPAAIVPPAAPTNDNPDTTGSGTGNETGGGTPVAGTDPAATVPPVGQTDNDTSGNTADSTDGTEDPNTPENDLLGVDEGNTDSDNGETDGGQTEGQAGAPAPQAGTPQMVAANLGFPTTSTYPPPENLPAKQPIAPTAGWGTSAVPPDPAKSAMAIEDQRDTNPVKITHKKHKNRTKLL